MVKIIILLISFFIQSCSLKLRIVDVVKTDSSWAVYGYGKKHLFKANFDTLNKDIKIGNVLSLKPTDTLGNYIFYKINNHGNRN